MDLHGKRLSIQGTLISERRAELLAASDYSQPQSPEEREWVDAPAVGDEPL